jgi:hypothetical protein
VAILEMAHSWPEQQAVDPVGAQCLGSGLSATTHWNLYRPRFLSSFLKKGKQILCMEAACLPLMVCQAKRQLLMEASCMREGFFLPSSVTGSSGSANYGIWRL